MSYADEVAILTGTASSDVYGNTTIDWTTPAAVDTPAWVGAQSTTEHLADGDRVITVLACHLPPDVTVSAENRILWRGDDYEINGQPLPVSRRGVLHHYELTLERVEG